MNPSAHILVRLSDQERYSAFRELNLQEKVRLGWEEKGWLERRVKESPKPKYIVPKGDLPVGTVGQLITYFIITRDGQRWPLVKTHQYKLPNGRITGGPDPLYIRLFDVVFTRVEKQRDADP